MTKQRKNMQYAYVFFVDLISLMLSMVISWSVIDKLMEKLGAYQFQDIAMAFSVLSLAYIITFLLFDQSQNIILRTRRDEIGRSVRFNLILFVINVAGLALTKAVILSSRYFLVMTPVLNILMMTAGQELLKNFLKKEKRASKMQSLVGIVTTRDQAREMVKELSRDWTKNITGVALLEIASSDVNGQVEGVELKANYNNFMDWIRQAALDEVYVNIPMDSGDSFIPYLEEMESMGLTVHFRLPLLDRIEEECCHETGSARLSRELSRCAGGNVVTIGTVELGLRDQVLKRALDIVGSLVGCILSIPIIAIVAIPLKLESPGPLVFKQRRVGRNGRIFYIHKLRSMYTDAEERKKELMAQNEMNGLMFKMQDDPRITKVGKFIRKTSIDELPQFFDVLRGDMSLVGTRPPTLDEYKQYESHHKRRLSMKPGITGLWQVSGRSNIEDFEDVVRLDVEYIDNWTIWSDIKILFKTVWVVFAGRGAK